MLKIGLIVYSCLLLASCATMGTESLSDRGADWPPLEMTKSDLIKELGQPSTSTVTVTDAGIQETLGWTYAHAESNPALFIPIVGLFVAASGEGMDVQSRALTVMFNQSGKMVSRSWAQYKHGS